MRIGVLDPACAGFSGRDFEHSSSSACSQSQAQRRAARAGLQRRPSLRQDGATVQTNAQSLSVAWPGDWHDSVDSSSDAGDSRPGFFAPNPDTRQQRPLKINQDLLLYRARQARQGACRAMNPATRARLQHEALQAGRKALAVNPSDGRAYVGLGKTLLQQRRVREARQVYEDGAAATGGSNEYIWQAWAVLEGRQGNTAYARRLFDAATVANDRHAAAWHGWGLLEKQDGNLERARDLWIRGVRACIGQPNPYLFQSLAMLLAEVGRTEEARQWFKQGTSTLPGAQSTPLWHAWAQMEERQGDQQLVRYLFTRGLKANPKSRYIYLSWAGFEEARGHPTHARQLLQQGHAFNERDPAILQAWALLEARAGRIEQARALFEKGSQADPQHVHIWQAWGVLEYRAGCLDRARDLFQQGVWADANSPDTARVFQAWGVLEERAGNSRLARELFKCAVKADPMSEMSWLSWASLEARQGALVRANELRQYRLQKHTTITVPSSFRVGDPEAPLIPIFTQIAEWFSRVDATRAKAMSRGTARRLPAALQAPFESDSSTAAAAAADPYPVDLEAARAFDADPFSLPALDEQ